MQTDKLEEARRQLQVCNACRYCEGYCSVFPAINRKRSFSDGDIVHLANLCHNCRGCYYACQYTEPHEFDINIPQILAEIRQESWQDFAWPSALSRLFRCPLALMLASVAGITIIFLLANLLAPTGRAGFYGVMSHELMVAVFAPAFLLPLFAIFVAMYRYWKHASAREIGSGDMYEAMASAATMNNLSGGHGEGCNFEETDRYSNLRRYLHQLTMYGFLMCFGATSVATVMHYAFDMPAPYGLFSIPKLLGVPGGLILSIGTAGLIWLKHRGERHLADKSVWSGEMAFVALLFLVSTSGLLLYALGNTALMPSMLAIHLGSVLTFFLLAPYTKMMHGFMRLTALAIDAADKGGK